LYNFVLNMWIMKNFTQAQVQTCVTKGYITQEEATTILATPQV